MKKTYKVPTCSMLGKMMTQVFCGSPTITGDGLEIGFGGKDGSEEGMDADGNKATWDSFEKGF